MLQRGLLPTSGIDSSVLLAPWRFVSYIIFPPKKGVRDPASYLALLEAVFAAA